MWDTSSNCIHIDRSSNGSDTPSESSQLRVKSADSRAEILEFWTNPSDDVTPEPPRAELDLTKTTTDTMLTLTTLEPNTQIPDQSTILFPLTN